MFIRDSLSLAKDKKIKLTQQDDELEVEMLDSDINFDVEDDYTNDNE